MAITKRSTHAGRTKESYKPVSSRLPAFKSWEELPLKMTIKDLATAERSSVSKIRQRIRTESGFPKPIPGSFPHLWDRDTVREWSDRRRLEHVAASRVMTETTEAADRELPRPRRKTRVKGRRSTDSIHA